MTSETSHMMQKATPGAFNEPWRVIDWAGTRLMESAAQEVVTTDDSDETPLDYWERAVACVNACKGIPSEALESGAIAEAIRLCREMVDVIEGRPSRNPFVFVDDCRRLVAKAEGRE